MSRRPVVAQARVLRRVRAGERVRDAIAAEFYPVRAVWRWRKRYPDFAAELDQAKRDARAMDSRKQVFLAALYAGASIDQAAAQAGVSRSAGLNWSREYPTFSAVYRRITGRRVADRQAERAAKHEAFFAAIEAGAKVKSAARAAEMDVSSPYAWKRTAPHLYARFRAIVEGRRTERAA